MFYQNRRFSFSLFNLMGTVCTNEGWLVYWLYRSDDDCQINSAASMCLLCLNAHLDLSTLV